MGAIQGQVEAERRPDLANHRKLNLSKHRSTTFLVSGMSCSWEGSLAPLWSPLPPAQQVQLCVLCISDLAMSSQTDVFSIIPAVKFSKQGKQDLAGSLPPSWICS